MTCKKKIAPWILLKLKKLFIETVQQDARNIFYVTDFLFRPNCRLYLFLTEFSICVSIFTVFLTNLYVKVIHQQENLFNFVFSDQGLLPLLKIIKINSLQLIFVLILSEKSEIIADFSKSSEKLSKSPIYVSHYILKKKWNWSKIFFMWKHYSTGFLINSRWKSPEGYKSQFDPLKLVFFSFFCLN